MQPLDAVTAIRGKASSPGYCEVDFDEEQTQLEAPWFLQFKTENALSCFATSVNTHWKELYQVSICSSMVLLTCFATPAYCCLLSSNFSVGRVDMPAGTSFP